jgi:tetratricopeptide (TPR) repeat protein
MKNVMHDMELAEQFLSGKLGEPERKELAIRFDQDSDFNKLVLDMDRLVEGIKSTANKTSIEEKITRLKKFAQTEGEENEKRTEPSEKVIKLWPATPVHYAIAASVVLFATLIFSIVGNINTAPPDLFAQYFEPFDSPGSGLTRSSDNAASLKAEAYEAYDAANYTLAAELFEKVLLEKDEAIVHLCLANAYVALNDFEKAEANLQHMLKEHADLVTQTKWYLALIYLKQNKLERAKATLWEISNSSTYGEKAKKVLGELD